jgi:hypothetical protein
MAIQVAGLRNSFPSGAATWNRNRVTWRGKIVPSEYSRAYTVELIYEQGSVPRVWVRDPNLKELAGERSLPHVYDEKEQELCLYLPHCGLWGAEKSVASTVMLWACLWLYYFELWLVSNVWSGRGEHPAQPLRPLGSPLPGRPPQNNQQPEWVGAALRR